MSFCFSFGLPHWWALLGGGASAPPEPFPPLMNFSDPRNSQYLIGTMSIGVGVN